MKKNNQTDDLDLFAMAKAREERKKREARREMLKDQAIKAAFAIAVTVIAALIIRWLTQ